MSVSSGDHLLIDNQSTANARGDRNIVNDIFSFSSPLQCLSHTGNIHIIIQECRYVEMLFNSGGDWIPLKSRQIGSQNHLAVFRVYRTRHTHADTGNCFISFNTFDHGYDFTNYLLHTFADFSRFLYNLQDGTCFINFCHSDVCTAQINTNIRFHKKAPPLRLVYIVSYLKELFLKYNKFISVHCSPSHMFFRNEKAACVHCRRL